MAKYFYKAVHSSGAVHLRASSGKGNYKFCVASRLLSSASFCSRLDLAQKEQAKRAKWSDAAEILPVVEITSAEHARLTKANQVTTAVTFIGKKFTTSRPVDQQPIVAVLGLFKAASEQRVELGDKASAETRARHPEGFYTYEIPEYLAIHSYHDLARAQEALAERIAQGYTAELFEIANG